MMQGARNGCGRLTAKIAAAVVAFVIVLVAVLAVERERPLILPRPTGPFAVGRTLYDWRDSTQIDALAPRPGTHRELLVWMWYPADATMRGNTEEYVPPVLQRHSSAQRTPWIFRLLTRQSSKVREQSVANAAVAAGSGPYPVLVMRGGASSPVANYSTLAEDLASHGYVVVGFDAPFRTSQVLFPDGRIADRSPANNPELVFGSADSARVINRLLDAWVSDIGFVLDRLQQLDAADPTSRFTGHLDLSRVGAFGHSLGGVEAAQFCDVDIRCKAAVDIDGALVGRVVRDTVRRPFMFLMSDHHKETDPESRHILGDIQAAYDRLPANGRLNVFIQGANHFTFSDDGALLKSGAVRLLLRAFGQLHIQGRRQLEVTAYVLRTFFAAALTPRPLAAPVAILSPAYPELRNATQ